MDTAVAEEKQADTRMPAAELEGLILQGSSQGIADPRAATAAKVVIAVVDRAIPVGFAYLSPGDVLFPNEDRVAGAVGDLHQTDPLAVLTQAKNAGRHRVARPQGEPVFPRSADAGGIIAQRP